MKVFVTSNQQFGRPNAIKLYGRPFDTVEEMNNHLIEQWNSVVSKDDVVYVLGNFAWDPETAEAAVMSLNGEIIVLPGEYDKAMEELDSMHDTLPNVIFASFDVEYITEIKAAISYWPLLDWPLKSKGVPSVIGHPSPEYTSDHKRNVINCKCDAWDFKPVDVDKIRDLFNSIK